MAEQSNTAPNQAEQSNTARNQAEQRREATSTKVARGNPGGGQGAAGEGAAFLAQLQPFSFPSLGFTLTISS